ncbi:MAG: flavodoxin family protein [Firmicutes bacterium]|nr:flavodoxin family protein [Bacillota bacterium]
MKVMLVNGSPHKQGCTYTALSEVAQTLNKEGIKSDIYWIGNEAITGCIACRKCVKLGRCTFHDSVNEFRNKAANADGFIFGTPVHYSAASGNMTSFMDRLFYSELGGNENQMFRLKPAACVLSARRAGTTAAYDQMNKYFGLHEMPIVSAKYWNMVHGARPEDVLQDAEGLFNMRTLARNMAFFLKCRQAGLDSGIKQPKQEPQVFTNFIR